MSFVTPADLNRMMVEISTQLDVAQEKLKDAAVEAADAERNYRREKAKAWLSASVESVKLAAAREAQVDANTADLRHARDLALDMKRAAWMWLEVLKAKLSALQSISSAVREEVRMAGRYSESA